jgi:hypothetical protein
VRRGRSREPTTDTDADSLYRLPEYGASLDSYVPSDNSAIQARLDELLRDAAGA